MRRLSVIVVYKYRNKCLIIILPQIWKFKIFSWLFALHDSC